MVGGGGGWRWGRSQAGVRETVPQCMWLYLTEAGQEWPLAMCRRCATAGVMAMRYSDRD